MTTSRFQERYIITSEIFVLTHKNNDYLRLIKSSYIKYDSY